MACGSWRRVGSRALSAARLETPPVGEPRDARVPHPGADGERVQAAVVVVGVAVAGVRGDVQEVVPLDELEPLDLHGDHALTVDLPEREPLERGVGPVAAHPVLAKDADAEDRIVEWPMRPEGQPEGTGLARLEQVPLAPGPVGERDAAELDLAATPPRGSARPGDGLGLSVLDAEGPRLLARHVIEVPADDRPGLPVGLEPSPIEPHRLVAEALDAR